MHGEGKKKGERQLQSKIGEKAWNNKRGMKDGTSDKANVKSKIKEGKGGLP